MPHRAFLWFILPSGLAMAIFIALPIASAVLQSLFVAPEHALVASENCGPFGCTQEMHVDADAAPPDDAGVLGRFNGLATYADHNHLAFDDVSGAWSQSATTADFARTVTALPFYRALAFTVTYTFAVTPVVLLLGLMIALAVNGLPAIAKGPVIFTSLLPMIITPLIGSLVLFWMIDADGILGSTLQRLTGDPDLSLKASATLTWVMLIVYGIWNAAPFAFVVFYAGLQTLPHDTLESAMIDGASRWQRVRFVVVPHLMPLVVFITLIQTMDNFRVFEPVVGFNAEANATSLSWIIYNDLHGGGVQLFGSASATSVLTMAGVTILMMPVLIRTWRDFARKR